MKPIVIARALTTALAASFSFAAAAASAGTFEARERDWRNGAIVYQVIVDRLFAFERHTDRAPDTRIVVVNPGPTTVRERLMVANPDLMDDTPMVDVLGLVRQPAPMSFGPGFLMVELPPHSAVVLQPTPKALGGYSRYKRVP